MRHSRENGNLQLLHSIKNKIVCTDPIFFNYSTYFRDSHVGGERTRLAMIKLLLQPVNLLILDEPTNHLDIKTKDILKDALKAFDGTMILVSHDRDFLDGLANKVFEFGNKRVREHFEDINGFLRNKKLENLKEIERKVKV